MNTQQQSPFWLETKPVYFPPSKLAMKEPNGLLAVGGDLTPEWLLMAYSKGIFPWFNPEDPILWWTPNPRSVLFIEDLKIKRSLKQAINKYAREQDLKVTLDTDFKTVMQACSSVPREGQDGTWITDNMLNAYATMHNAGHAHSVEVWLNNELVGGLYGIAIGKMFFGESMFSKQANTSKIALVALTMQLKQWGFSVIDTQVETAHLNSLGAKNMSREDFEALIKQQTQKAFPPKKWQFDCDWRQLLAEHKTTKNT